MAETFVCAVCGEVCDLADLGETSLAQAGTTSPKIALKRLSPDQRVCCECDVIEVTEEYRDLYPSYFGQSLTQVESQWLSLNY